MILEEIFKKSGYTNIVDKKDAIEYHLFVDMFYEDEEIIPQELKYLYISKTCDELFFVLDGRKGGISELCEKWDRKISAFMNYGSDDRKVLKKLKYNVVQIVLYDLPISDRSKEGSLDVTRKMLLPCDFLDNGVIEISDDEAVEIPFYLIKADELQKNIEIINRLKYFLPAQEDENLDLLHIKRKPIQKRVENKILKKNYEDEEYKKIKEWLNTYADTKD